MYIVFYSFEIIEILMVFEFYSSLICRGNETIAKICMCTACVSHVNLVNSFLSL
jgi:hypothetical protein